METAILAVIVIFGFVGLWLYIRDEFRRIQIALGALALSPEVEEILSICQETQEVLREASRLKALREPQPKEDKDTIRRPIRPVKYTGIAARRMAAERQSQGPQTHSEKIAQNNAKAMEA